MRQVSIACCALVCGLTLCGAAQAKDKKIGVKSGFVTTSDGVRIHYIEAGRADITPAGQIGNPMPSTA
ncbi:MAG: hypothetical protein WA886_13120, partial [Candidatus Acidiferrales bacterium]